MTTTPNSDELKAVIREAGGIVHSDGNIFFTNAEQFLKAARTQPGMASQWRDIATDTEGEKS